MAEFSWLTADTKVPVKVNEPRCVYLLQPHGLPSIPESCYQGFGVFGGVDVFEWLAMNNPDTHSQLLSNLHMPFMGFDRSDGILLDSIFHGRSPNPWDLVLDYPIKLSHDPRAVYEIVDFSQPLDDPADFYCYSDY